MSEESSSSSPPLSAEEAKNQVNECEKEIANIKARLKALGPASASEDAETKNSLTVTLVKTEGLPKSADLRLKVQLSSPIEEAVLTSSHKDAVFRAVELGQAMLSMTASDADKVPLGSCEAMDLAPLIQLDAMNASATQTYAVEKQVAFKADYSDAAAPPLFTATLKLTFVPSPKDQREELYEMLNKATSRKAQAVEKLRQSALAASRQNSTAVAKKGASPAVKPGFLNKGSSGAEKKEKGVLAFVDKYFGPQSILRQVLPVAKNYVIFFAAAALFHYKGDALALPPPV